MLSSEEREGTMKIGIIGLGKVGSAFLKACAVTAALQVVSVKAGRSPESCARLAGMGDFQITSVGAEVLAAADVVLLAVPDGQIAAAAETLAAEVGTAGRRDILSKKVCLHCSGSLGLDPLAALSALGIHCGIHCRALPEAVPDLKISAWLLMVIMKHSKLPVIWPKRFRHIHSEFLKRSAVPIMRLLVFVLIIL